MRFHLHRNVAAASAGVALLAVASGARAQQLDTNPPAPNVLLLLDNSGSMERMIDGNLPENDGNACNYDMNGQAIPTRVPPQPNRWGNVLQALTGTFENNQFNCIDMPRTSGGQFVKEYQIGGQRPYDADYYLDYHRPVLLDPSTTPPTACVIAPGSLPGAAPGTGVGPTGAGSGNNGPKAGQAATDFPPDGIIMRPFSQTNVVANPASGACSQFPSKQYTSYQYQDGAIPSTTNLIRFGLMTFDQDPSAGIGVTTGPSPTVITAGVGDPLSNAFGAFAGMWSYFPGWNTGAACNLLGNPIGCTTKPPTPWAVGARNPAAPPWEGRMMPFPSTDVLTDQTQNNTNIANVILAARPYGGTPLAGMLQGAEYYFWNDPAGPQKTDPLVYCGDRPQYIILLTDGAPNLDMRPDCGKGDAMTTPVAGLCPFHDPAAIVAEMNAGGSNLSPITTYVIGFAVSEAAVGPNLYQCSTFFQGQANAGVCANQSGLSPDAAACCKLQEIALAGSQNIVSNNVVVPNPNPQPAFFADTPGALKNALATILANISKSATTRTTPTYSASTQSIYADPTNAPTNVGEQFLASFNPSPGRPVTGDLLRSRDVCQSQMGSYTVTQSPPDPTQGDDFAANLNSNTGNPRTFIAFQPDLVTTSTGQAPKPANTIRPYVSTTVKDGIGQYSATTYSGPASSIIPNISPAALNITQPYPYSSASTNIPVSPGLTTNQEAEMMLDYEFGQQLFASNPGNFPFVSRFGSAFGGIYHAAPAVVGPPSTLLQDPGYVGFQATWQTRKTTAYVATTDGLLHAFWADENKLENNERWAMLLPAVMPNVPGSYPNGQAPLLDGSLIVKDVAWDRSITTAVDPTTWHTMLLASFGPNARGYYAVDVTNPDASALGSGVVPPDAPTSGPHFRWQLTTVPLTNYLIFGKHAATPAITTLFMDPGDGLGAREIGVAILPGGSDDAPSTVASCARTDASSNEAQPVGGYAYRANVRCWGGNLQVHDEVNGRSLAIVRIDTGEILRVFTRQTDDVLTNHPNDTLFKNNRIIDTPLDSPMTGTPVVYPGDVATDATKVFITDADGTLWRFDLSSSDPTNWKGELFLDLYNQTADPNPTAWSEGQPVSVTPTLSTDANGEIVLNAATGTTDSFDQNGIEFVYSMTEKVQTLGGGGPKLRAFVNWYMRTPLTAVTPALPQTPEMTASSPAFLPGERVAGPMVVFDSKLYFATYAVPAPTPSTCIQNFARIWGVDFATPADPMCNTNPGMCNRALGGAPGLMVNNTLVTDFQPLATATGLLKTAVVPGLGINATPACGGAGPSQTDQYVGGGAQHAATQGLSSGGFSLSATAGAPNKNGTGTATVNVPIPPPFSPTQIDSWATVME